MIRAAGIGRILRRVLDRESVDVLTWTPPERACRVAKDPPEHDRYQRWSVAAARRDARFARSDYHRRALTDWPADWPAESIGGALSHALVENGAVVAWGFSVTGVTRWPIDETRTRLECDTSDILLLGFYTEPSHRGRGLYRTLLSNILHRNPIAGRAIIWVQQRNATSRRAILDCGFVVAATHRALKAGGVIVWRASLVYST